MPGLVYKSRRDWLERVHGMEFGNNGDEEIIFRVNALWHTGASMNFVIQSVQNDLANRYMSGDFRNPQSATREGQARIRIGYKLWHFDRSFGGYEKEHPAKIIERIRQLLLPLSTSNPYQDHILCERIGDVSVPCMTIEKEPTYQSQA